uniref:RING-type domain-containing protein n=1 Tax=Panagrellus redivivus TaxID=6233 RepID=A0A7E4VK78_PANRE
MANVRAVLSEIFPNINVDAVLREFEGMPLINLANLVADIPPYLTEYRKEGGQGANGAAGDNNNEDNAVPPAALTSTSSRRLDQLVGELLAQLRADMATDRMPPFGGYRNLLVTAFTTLSPELMDAALEFAENRRVSAFVVVFLAFNGLSDRLEGTIPRGHAFWRHNERRGEPSGKSREKFTKAGFQDVNAVLNIVKKYGGIVNFRSLLLTKQFTCAVCFDSFFKDMSVICGSTTNPDGSEHQFCRGCLQAHAAAATHEMPLAEFGAGLKCMEHRCQRPIYLADIRHLLAPKVLKRLDDRIFEENIAAAGLPLERCQNCNFAAEIIEPKEQRHVFICPNCDKAWCRLCQKPWNDEHFGKLCNEFGAQAANDQYWRGVEARLNDVVARNCHRCNLQFVKSDGCNHMTCRCGAEQCYLCRAPLTDYRNHFCQHPNEPNQPGCRQCNKCKMFGDAARADAAVVDDIMRQANQENPKVVPVGLNRR